MKTVRLEVIKHCHIFQPGNILELDNPFADGDIEKEAAEYPIPDIGDGSIGVIAADCVKKLPEVIEKSGEYFGKCLLTRVFNFSKNDSATEENELENIGIVKPEQVRVIHYPACQQIVFHMPKYAYDAGIFQITDLVTGETLVNCAVSARLNGGTMIILDSLPMKPGFYRMEADWPGGWAHQIQFIKFAEGFPNAHYTNPPSNVAQAIKAKEVHLLNLPVVEDPIMMDVSHLGVPAPYEGYQHPPGSVSIIQNDDEYRLFDSNGVEIDNGVDLNKFKRDVASKFGPVVEYSQEGRGGNIYYREKDVNLTFDWEFAAGRGVAIIFVPEKKYWEAATKTPLSRRDEIIGKMARRVIEDKAPGCTFEDYDNHISIVRY